MRSSLLPRIPCGRKRRKVVIEAARIRSWIGVMTAERIARLDLP
jgi:hypothetical protein